MNSKFFVAAAALCMLPGTISVANAEEKKDSVVFTTINYKQKT